MLRRKDIGVGCNFEARGKTETEVLKKAAEHAKKEHGIEKVTEDYLESWKKFIRES